MFNKAKNFIERIEKQRKLEERVKKLEKELNSIKINVDVAMDARVAYLETKIIEIRKIKPIVDEMHEQIHGIYDNMMLKKQPEKPNDKTGMEIT